MIKEIYVKPIFGTIVEKFSVKYEEMASPFGIREFRFDEGDMVVVLAKISSTEFMSGVGYIIYVEDILQSFTMCSSNVEV